MNLKQLSYQYGRLKNSNVHVICPTLTAACLTCFCKASMNFLENGSARDFIFIPIFAYLGSNWGLLSIASIRSKKELNRLKKDKKQCLGNNDSVILGDKQGLEMLLEKTAKSKQREWATVLKAYNDKSRAVVYEILNPDLAEDTGIAKTLSKDSVSWDPEKMEEKGYTGTHHYHPNTSPKSLGGMHFAINLIDRVIRIGETNLLTFNLPEGPEIIGYDALHTYIPSDKSKQELVRATPKQIMEYLS